MRSQHIYTFPNCSLSFMYRNFLFAIHKIIALVVIFWKMNVFKVISNFLRMCPDPVSFVKNFECNVSISCFVAGHVWTLVSRICLVYINSTFRHLWCRSWVFYKFDIGSINKTYFMSQLSIWLKSNPHHVKFGTKNVLPRAWFKHNLSHKNFRRSMKILRFIYNLIRECNVIIDVFGPFSKLIALNFVLVIRLNSVIQLCNIVNWRQWL